MTATETRQHEGSEARSPDWTALTSEVPEAVDADDSGALRSAATPWRGLSRFFTYYNLSYPPADRAVSCGHACIVSIHDFFGRIDLPDHQRQHRGAGQADDGKLHFDNDTVVGAMFRRYPPTNWLGIRFSPRETIRAALHSHGIPSSEAHPALVGGTDARFEWAMGHLRQALMRRRAPVITLLDMKPLWGDNALHWGMVMAVNDTHVRVASWGQTFDFDHETFKAGWHCEGWIFPNNFYAIYV